MVYNYLTDQSKVYFGMNKKPLYCYVLFIIICVSVLLGLEPGGYPHNPPYTLPGTHFSSYTGHTHTHPYAEVKIKSLFHLCHDLEEL